MANKVKYGLKNVYYSKITVNTSGTETYATPVAMPGAVSLSLDAQGDINKFYADNTVFWQSASNNGYEGDLEIALIPESFRKDILNEAEDTNGLLVESNSTKANPFALLFEFNGDENARRHVLYNCSVTRPSVSGTTTEESIEPQTEKLTLSAVANTGGYIKASVSYSTSGAYADWFTSVHAPNFV